MDIKLLLSKVKEIIYNKLNKKTKSILFISGIFLLIFITYVYLLFLPKDVGSSHFVSFTINEGMTIKSLGQGLEKNGIIKSSLVFNYYTKLSGKDTDIKAGTYMLSPSMTLSQIMDKFVSGNILNTDIKVMIPEGTRLEKVGEILEGKGIIGKEEFLKTAKVEKFKSEKKFLKDVPENMSLEGFIFPDTYYLPKGQSATFYIDIFLKRFEEMYFEKGKFDKIKKPLDFNIYQLITIASIIESEAMLDEEKPIISGVFYNRLKRKMPLQSCSTVLYALNEHKEELSLDDIKVDSKYNTYANEGLPPGPIGSPGFNAIKAAVRPADTEYLYFRAKGDGSHIFNKTHHEHLEAIKLIKQSK